MDQFLISPMSEPVWKLMTHFGLQQNDPIIKKWWTKVAGEGKGDSQARLHRYLQALNYFNYVSNNFWTQISVNPTFFTIEAIAVRLTALGDWIRAASFDQYGWAEKFYLTAKSIVHDEPQGAAIMKNLEHIWPAGLKGSLIHYENHPFAKAEFIINEGTEQVVVSPPLKMYRFNPDKVWSEAEPTEPAPREPEVTRMVKKRKLENTSLIPTSLDPVDSEDDDGHVPFATIGADSNYLLV